jgi:outer membrane protein
MRTIFTILTLLIAGGLPLDGVAQISLSEAIDRSLEYSTNTRIAKENRVAANAASGIWSSDYIPRLSGSASYTKSQYPQIITPIRREGVFPPLDDQIYDATVQANWQIFDFGEGRAARKSAVALAVAAGISYDISRMETIESTVSWFVQLQQLGELKQVQQQRIEALSESKKRLQSLFKRGRIAEIDLLKIEDAIIEAQTDVLTTDNQIEWILQVLSDDMGLQKPLLISQIEPLQFESEQIFNPEAKSFNEVPLIAAARQKWQASKLEAKAAQRAFLPNLNLFAAEQFRTGGDFGVDDQWMVGVRMNIPLLNGHSMVKSQIMKSQAKSRKIELEQSEQTYIQQLNKLTNLQFEAQKKIVAARTRLKYLKETYRVEEVSYRNGKTTLTDLLLTESKLNSARMELINQQSRLRIINLNIAVLTGQMNKELAIKLAKGEQV